MKTITTPSGYKVEFKDRLTYGDRRAIKQIMLESMKMKMSVDKGNAKQEVEPLSLAFTAQMEEEVFKRAIVSIEIDGKKQSGDLLEVVYSWQDEDGQAVFDYLNNEFNPTGVEEQEKKTEN